MTLEQRDAQETCASSVLLCRFFTLVSLPYLGWFSSVFSSSPVMNCILLSACGVLANALECNRAWICPGNATLNSPGFCCPDTISIIV